MYIVPTLGLAIALATTSSPQPLPKTHRPQYNNLSMGTGIIVVPSSVAKRCRSRLSGGAAAFRKAGYEGPRIDSTSESGLVRQHGKLSFSSVWESVHDVGAFQLETNFRIFNRALFNKDVATGDPTVNDEYSTSGAASVYSVKTSLPANPTLTTVCILWNVAPSCTEEQFEALMNGTATIEDYIVISPDGSDGVPLGAAGGF
ncbi:hypothetical protein LTS10_012476 [Elasticomyces elasticus]|nr:hypothetical protein LTS10_012476 [Elasticomyces elasticus]